MLFILCVTWMCLVQPCTMSATLSLVERRDRGAFPLNQVAYFYGSFFFFFFNLKFYIQKLSKSAVFFFHACVSCLIYSWPLKALENIIHDRCPSLVPVSFFYRPLCCELTELSVGNKNCANVNARTDHLDAGCNEKDTTVYFI